MGARGEHPLVLRGMFGCYKLGPMRTRQGCKHVHAC